MGAVERKVQTASQSSTSVIKHGAHWIGTTIDWEFKFIGEPTLLLTGKATTGFATISLVSVEQDADGYYIGATVVTENCDYFNWEAKGSGVEGVT
jgi:hypothetical protein